MESPTRTARVLEFDSTSPETAAASVTLALVALQEAIVAAGLRSPLSAIEIVQLAAASCGHSLRLSSHLPLPVGAYSSEVSVAFPLPAGLSMIGGEVDLVIPAIGREGALGEPAVIKSRRTPRHHVVNILRTFWNGINTEYLRVTAA